MKLLKNILWVSVLLLSTQIQATVYENAEDESSSRWHVYDNIPSNAVVDNVYIKNRDNHAIAFRGSGTKNGYMLGNLEGHDGAWNNKTEQTIRWSMNFKENFTIYLRVSTTHGARYIYYTNSETSYGKHGEYIHIALGKRMNNGTWQAISRNLEVDLKTYEPNNSLVSVNAFLIRGNGLIDDINLTNQNTTYQATTSKYIYGLTLDDISNIDTTVDAIKSFSKRTTTRVVFDKVPASDYTNALQKLAPYTDIMGQLFDSEYIKDYSLEAYQNRVQEYLDEHSDTVQIWEIGNEVNGEWTGNPLDVATKTIAAYKEVKQRGYQTALTLYYNDYSENNGCWSNPDEKMREWAKNKLTDELKNAIDYVFISYYEEDCEYHQPTLAEWEKVFSDLAKIFPHAKLGFGEVGTTTQNKADYLKRYYNYDIKNPNYIGGHFWWYFKQDMVPKNKSLWKTFNQFLLKSQSSNHSNSINFTTNQRLIADKIISVFENSTTEIQYAFAKHIAHDQHGITVGRAGFTSATGDMLVFIKRYTKIKPNNKLSQYINELKRLNEIYKVNNYELSEEGADVTNLDGLIENWKSEAEDIVFRNLQDTIVNELYFNPILEETQNIGAQLPITLLNLYDAAIQHGIDGVKDIIQSITLTQPKNGGDEIAWLKAFNLRRLNIMKTTYIDGQFIWKDSIYRLHELNDIIESKNYTLEPFTMTIQDWGNEVFVLAL